MRARSKALIAIVLALLCGLQITRGFKIETDILALLPNANLDARVRSLRQIVSSNMGQTALFIVGHEDEAKARDAVKILAQSMQSSGLFAEVIWDHTGKQNDFFQFYFPRRYQFLSGDMRRQLQSEDPVLGLTRRLQSELYQPTSSFVTQFLEDDPLLFFTDLVLQLSQDSGALQVSDGLLGAERDDKTHYLITARLAGNPFARDYQDNCDKSWRSWRQELEAQFDDLEWHDTSVLRFARATRLNLQRDISMISIGSTVGILILILGCFGSLKQLLISALPLLAGFAGALAVSLTILGKLHVLTLVFGASLIGVCIDYTFHFFAHHRLAETWEPRLAMRRILPALCLGALTTLVSYVGLAFTRLSGLREIALFTGCGIVFSLVTVVVLFPDWMSTRHPKAPHQPKLMAWLENWLMLWRKHRFVMIIATCSAVLMAAAGLPRLHLEDSPSVLSSMPEELIAEEQWIRETMAIPGQSRYVLVSGDQAETVLQRLETLDDRFEQSNQPSPLGVNLSRFIASEQRQRDNHQTLVKLAEKEPQLRLTLTEIGLDTMIIDKLIAGLRGDLEITTPETWLASPVSQGLRYLWLGESKGQAASLVQLKASADVPYVRSVLADLEGVRVFDQIGDLTQILREYRIQAVRLVLAAYVAIALILFIRYRRRVLWVLLPPLLTALGTFGLLGWLGTEIHFMHFLALLLILGMGVDYTIFLSEERKGFPATFLALTLSALTTSLSFGLLSLSSQGVLQGMGLTTLIGMASTWLLAPLALPAREDS